MTPTEIVGEVEVEIETGPGHRTIIWVVAVGERAFVRTVYGPNSRWYREALAEPCAVIANRSRIPIGVAPVTDPALIDAVSAAYEAKYAGDPSTPLMVLPGVLGTTLELRFP